jgi:hypothetical protein
MQSLLKGLVQSDSIDAPGNNLQSSGVRPLTSAADQQRIAKSTEDALQILPCDEGTRRSTEACSGPSP